MFLEGCVWTWTTFSWLPALWSSSVCLKSVSFLTSWKTAQFSRNVLYDYASLAVSYYHRTQIDNRLFFSYNFPTECLFILTENYNEGQITEGYKLKVFGKVKFLSPFFKFIVVHCYLSLDYVIPLAVVRHKWTTWTLLHSTLNLITCNFPSSNFGENLNYY
jgi:hypothetical protein